MAELMEVSSFWKEKLKCDEEASPGWQNTACMLAAVRGQHRHEASRGHRRVAGVMDMAELLES